MLIIRGALKLIYDLDSLASLIKAHLIGDFANPQYYPDLDTPIERQLAEQFIYIYSKWKKDGELLDTGVDADGIQNNAAPADPEPDNECNLAVEHPDAEDGG